jgi:hypothetical protein
MTTDETQVDETQVEGQEKPRDVSVLLTLDTYQGMSDEEIDSVIRYKVNESLMSAENAAKMNTFTQVMNDVISQTETAAQMVQQQTEQILANCKPTLVVM